MVEIGVAAYLLKPFNRETASAKLQSIFFNPQQKEKRQHIRVQPDPDELLRLHFRLSDCPGLISGKIRDISMGGVAIKLFNLPKEDCLKKGIRIPSFQFVLSTKQLNLSGFIVLCKEKFIAIRFEPVSAADKDTLARYIYKKISSGKSAKDI